MVKGRWKPLGDRVSPLSGRAPGDARAGFRVRRLPNVPGCRPVMSRRRRTNFGELRERDPKRGAEGVLAPCSPSSSRNSRTSCSERIFGAQLTSRLRTVDRPSPTKSPQTRALSLADLRAALLLGRRFTPCGHGLHPARFAGSSPVSRTEPRRGIRRGRAGLTVRSSTRRMRCSGDGPKFSGRPRRVREPGDRVPACAGLSGSRASSATSRQG